jgi:hypothetical protein
MVRVVWVQEAVAVRVTDLGIREWLDFPELFVLFDELGTWLRTQSRARCRQHGHIGHCLGVQRCCRHTQPLGAKWRTLVRDADVAPVRHARNSSNYKRFKYTQLHERQLHLLPI